MSWRQTQCYSLQLLVDQVASKLGIKPADLLTEEKAAIIEGINYGISTAWDHYLWPEILEVYTGSVTTDSDSTIYTSILDSGSAEMLTIEGVYKSHPGKNPLTSPYSFSQVGDRLYILDAATAPTSVYVRYWPVPPVYDTSHLSAGTTAISTATTTSSMDVVPYIFYRYLLFKAYADMLAGDGQTEKSAIASAEAEKILFQEQDKSERKNQGVHR